MRNMLYASIPIRKPERSSKKRQEIHTSWGAMPVNTTQLESSWGEKRVGVTK